jgi:hypothetical protein
MDEEAEAGRELERLRAELTAFVVDAMSERMASGAQPELSAALAEAIDRRVDRAVEARVADLRWPDPEDFAGEVIAAARRNGGGGDGATRPGRPSGAKAGSARAAAALPFGLGFITALGVVLVAYLVYASLQRPAPAPVAPPAPIANGVEPTSTGPVNVTVEPANLQAPAG